MKAFYVTVMLLAAGSVTASAQRLDGCVAGPTNGAVTAPTDEARDDALQHAGYSLKTDSLLSALKDPRADIRSLAALKLAKYPRPGALSSLMAALSAERDACTKAAMEGAVAAFERVSPPSGPKPGESPQPRPTPFQPCTPSGPRVIALDLGRSGTPGAGGAGPTLRISVRNLTDQAVPFPRYRSPLDLFSATVLDPSGGHAVIVKDKEYLYHPLPPNMLRGHSGPLDPVLGPDEEVSWEWKVSEDFDISAPGTYQVRLGGKVAYLGTTVCSNTIEVRVGK